MVNPASRPPRHAALRGVVSWFWLSHLTGQPGAHVVLPNGRAQIVVDLHGGTALLVGPRTTSARVEISGTTAGLALTAVGLSRVVQVPAHELVDEVVDLHDFWGGSRWLRRLEHARSAEELLSGLERETVCHLRPAAPDPRLVAAEQAIRRGVATGSIADAVGADRRWLVPRFRQVVGVAPKHYQRILRFQAALGGLRVADPAQLAAIAADAGYADQAHMSREFTEMAGIAPSRLRGAATAQINHVPLDLAGAWTGINGRGSAR
ncbi:helix-turn-helix domain-containing protein [Plantactinospora sp. GCM10030261]|uniref:helix-turn-helix domain-containing protein n=1 Tax=Plantactinospora sp. GCM10030261 TaxID=3273420 RepID=UPI003608A1E0